MALNNVTLMGNITADPELRQTTNGDHVLSFRIAVPKPLKKDAEDGRPSADFISCVAWRQTAENIAKYFKKGQRIIVTGAISTRDYTDKEGNKRYSTEVVVDRFEFVERRGSSNTSDEAPSPAATHVPAAAPAYAAPATDGFPF